MERMAGLRLPRGRRLVLLAATLAGLTAAASMSTWSAFTSTTANENNHFVTGTVALSDNNGDTAMLSLPDTHTGDSTTGCIDVTYTGTSDASVRLYANTTFTSGSSLAPYLNLTVTRGTGTTGAFPTCTDFSADATDYVGAGAGVIYNGTLSAFPANYNAGVVDPTSGTPATWQENDGHVYRFVVTVADDNNAQGKNATTAFTWEARNT